MVVSLVFLIPATVLGMVGPVVAKIAVEQARKAGSAIGDVYFWGAVGSIVGTFFCGFVLIYLAPSSIIVLLIAAGAGGAGRGADERHRAACGGAGDGRAAAWSARSSRCWATPASGHIAWRLVPDQLPGAGRQSGRLRAGVHGIEGAAGARRIGGGAAPGKAAAGSSKAA